MDDNGDDVCEKVCLFEDSAEIDLDYEFDVAKFFDFSREDTGDEIQEAEIWFQFAKGYPTSPLVLKLEWELEETEDAEISSSKNDDDSFAVSEISSLEQGKKGLPLLKSKSKCPSSSSLSRTSRLLKPTASQLAKQNLQSTVVSTRTPGRLQKLGSALKFPGEIDATKRQKLEIGYLRKNGYLKHQTSFSHKLPKKVGTTYVNSSVKPKATTAKVPELETAHRAQRHRSKHSEQPGNNSKFNHCNTSVLLEEETDQASRFKVQPSNKKEFKLSGSKKLSQNLPIDLFKKLSLNSENKNTSLTEQKQPSPIKGLKKSLSGSMMKENKIPAAVTESSRRCLKQNQFGAGRAITRIVNHPMSARSVIIR